MKDGISYFPLDCQMDEKMELLEAEFGLRGFGIIIKLLQRIYGGNGYYCEWSEKINILFASRVHESKEYVKEVITGAMKCEMFSQKLFDGYGILTSQGIQKRYLDAVKRRKDVALIEQYSLLPKSKISKNVCSTKKSEIKAGKSASVKSKSVDKPHENVNISEAAANTDNVQKPEPKPPIPESPTFITLTINDGTEYPITEQQIKEWEELYPAVDVKQALRNMKGWISSNKKRRKTKTGVLAFITNWLKRDQDKGGAYRGVRQNYGASYHQESSEGVPNGTQERYGQCY